ncbi:MAG: type II toxin-antitoxin system YafQ family toxin, partial [Oscillospiraceae bacterium]|nr:type II toxin-antitoxin system YafQ family toxin [Oscillospiraceae bacterium]
MINADFTVKYRKDYKKLIKQHKDISKLDYYVDLVICEKTLPPNCRDHSLQGEFSGCRGLHVEPDWVLVYK